MYNLKSIIIKRKVKQSGSSKDSVAVGEAVVHMYKICILLTLIYTACWFVIFLYILYKYFQIHEMLYFCSDKIKPSRCDTFAVLVSIGTDYHYYCYYYLTLVITKSIHADLQKSSRPQ